MSDLEEKRKRLEAAYDVLRHRGLAFKHDEVADKMGASRSNVTAALNGKEKVLTDKFLRRFNAAYGGMFSEEWLLRGEGEMMRQPITQTVNGDGNTSVAGNGNHVNSDLGRALDEIAAQRRVTEKAQEQIDRLLSIIENMNK